MRSLAHWSSPAANAALRNTARAASQPVAAQRNFAHLPGHSGFGRDAGQPLERAARADMERRFAQDFSGVRVHTDADATRHVGAQAFTAGANIVFAPGRYAPATSSGRGLLAHELAHVVQQRKGRAQPDAISRLGDRDEGAAHRAVYELAQGRIPALGAASVGVHRQVAGDAPGLAPAGPSLLPSRPIVPQQSSQELILESFLNRMWAAQSDRQQPFRLTAKVLEGLALVFPLGAPLGPITDFQSTEEVMTRLRPRLTAPIDPAVEKVLDRLPAQEKPLPRVPSAPTGAAAPKLPAGVKAPAEIADPRKPPAPGNNYEEAMTRALEAAFESFRATRLGRELEKSVKEYVFSKKGIPLVILVTAAGLTFLAANDPKLPSVPGIPVGDGITLMFDVSAKSSELPGLLNDLVHQRLEAPGAPERKVGVTATFTFEALGEMAMAVGHFFAEAGVWIGKGIVTAGTVIAKGVAKGARAADNFLSKLPPELVFGAGGAALGAGIGALAGGGLGALIGAGVGLGVGVGAGLLKRFMTQPAT